MILFIILYHFSYQFYYYNIIIIDINRTQNIIFFKVTLLQGPSRQQHLQSFQSTYKTHAETYLANIFDKEKNG